MTHLRAFIAIDVPQATQDAIEKETSRLQHILGAQTIRWAPASNMHLTLKFLGNIPETHIDFFKQMLTQITETHSAFDLSIGGLGSFSSGKLVRVLWLGIQPTAELTSIQRDVEAGARRLGYEKEARAFYPHLTLGRVKQNIHPNEMQSIRSALQTFQFGKIPSARVDSLHLYQSELRPKGSVYTKLFSVKLKRPTGVTGK